LAYVIVIILYIKDLKSSTGGNYNYPNQAQNDDNSDSQIAATATGNQHFSLSEICDLECSGILSKNNNG
jgi:hypothetical protein